MLSGWRQDYIFNVNDIPINGNFDFAVRYVIPTDQLVITGDDNMSVRFRGDVYTTDHGVILINGPFSDPSGSLEVSAFWDPTVFLDLEVGPFIIPNNDIEMWGGILDGVSGYYAGVGKVRGLHHGFITGASKSFGFGMAVDKIFYSPNQNLDAVNPVLFVAASKSDYLFLPEFFSQNTAALGGELGIYAKIIDQSGNSFTTPDSSFYNHYVNALQRENTQNFTIGQTSVNRGKIVKNSEPQMRSVPNPIGFKVENKSTTEYPSVDHYEINFNGTPLTNYMYPSSVWMPDNTWRLMAYNRTAKRYDVFSSTKKNGTDGFMTTVWTSEYHAAHMTRLIDGTICAMAWTYSDQDKKYFLWFKRSCDDGANWEDALLVASFSSTVTYGKTFNPTWCIVQNYELGTVVIGDYFSDDMGRTWRLSV